MRGELLGEEQSGQIQEIGFELYNEMLNRTVKALEAGLEPDLDNALPPVAEINLRLPALLPDDYLPDVHLRLVHYKRIAKARSEAELRDLQIELIDRSDPCRRRPGNLFRLTVLRLRPNHYPSSAWMPRGGWLRRVWTRTTLSPAWIVARIRTEPETYRLDRQQKLRFSENLEDTEARFAFVEYLISEMC
ncbi:MAG: TRCF domain-containing protein [Gammaproteobacteria bacterium]